jgi:hypothetical protein
MPRHTIGSLAAATEKRAKNRIFFAQTAIANRQSTSRDALQKKSAKAHVIIDLQADCGM